jgi:hypothetical protein
VSHNYQNSLFCLMTTTIRTYSLRRALIFLFGVLNSFLTIGTHLPVLRGKGWHKVYYFLLTASGPYLPLLFPHSPGVDYTGEDTPLPPPTLRPMMDTPTSPPMLSPAWPEMLAPLVGFACARPCRSSPCPARACRACPGWSSSYMARPEVTEHLRMRDRSSMRSCLEELPACPVHGLAKLFALTPHMVWPELELPAPPWSEVAPAGPVRAHPP